jgi:hypothetical protein
MTATPSILEYASGLPGGLSLEERDGCLRVIFPVVPKWLHISVIVFKLACAAAMTVIFIMMVRLVMSMSPYTFGNPRFPPPQALFRQWHFLIAEAMLGYGSIVLWHWLEALHLWWRYRRWGVVPRMLTLTEDELIVSRLGVWKMRSSRWPAGDILAIELTKVWGNLSHRRTVQKLKIHRRSGRSLRFTLSSRNQALPAQIAERLAAVLGCPLTWPTRAPSSTTQVHVASHSSESRVVLDPGSAGGPG